MMSKSFTLHGLICWHLIRGPCITIPLEYSYFIYWLYNVKDWHILSNMKNYFFGEICIKCSHFVLKSVQRELWMQVSMTFSCSVMHLASCTLQVSSTVHWYSSLTKRDISNFVTSNDIIYSSLFIFELANDFISINSTTCNLWTPVTVKITIDSENTKMLYDMFFVNRFIELNSGDR